MGKYDITVTIEAVDRDKADDLVYIIRWMLQAPNPDDSSPDGFGIRGIEMVDVQVQEKGTTVQPPRSPKGDEPALSTPAAYTLVQKYLASTYDRPKRTPLAENLGDTMPIKNRRPDTVKIVTNACYGGFSVSELVYRELGIRWDGFGFLDNKALGIPDSEPRHAYRADPGLIAAIEKVGVRLASGDSAHLRIIELPADVKWEIDEYDGIETVHEVHRSW